VRQLHHVLRSAVALSDGAPLTLDHFPTLAVGGVALQAPLPPALPLAPEPDLPSLTPELLQERQALRAQLEALRWNVSHVAKALGISRNTLYRRMHKLCIPVTQNG
jgi:transcriptional regulator of acetoin/glycerol metabolism